MWQTFFERILIRLQTKNNYKKHSNSIMFNKFLTKRSLSYFASDIPAEGWYRNTQDVIRI